MRGRHRYFAPVGLLWCAFLAAPAAAQGPPTGSINGEVRDNTGAVVPGVTVTAKSPSEIATLTAVTNERGRYRFTTVAPGTYTLTFELTGFSKVVQEGITVNIGFTATVDPV